MYFRTISTGFTALALSLMLSACSEDGGARPTPIDASTRLGNDSSNQRPEGPIADVTEEISGDNAPFIGSAPGWSIPDGYVEREYVASGAATAYQSNDALSGEGLWTFESTTTAEYRTRILVRRPEAPEAFSGTVIVG